MKRVGIWFFCGILILGFIGSGNAFAEKFRRAETFEDAWKASCRVSVANARGSGTFIGEDEENNRCVIFTNYHVVSNQTKATLDFWTNGVRQSIQGTVFWRAYDAKAPYDFALIAVDTMELKKIDPPFVALGGKGAAPDSNSYILSSGCPKGRFAQAWKGKVLGYYNGSTVMFQPGPVPGQSGSAVISEIDGELWVTAILTWLLGTEGSDDSKGGAIPIANLYDALQGRQSASDSGNESPIPPGAVECAERVPYVLEFSQNDCAPCVKAETEIKTLRANGVSVQSYNISTSKEGAELAQKHGIRGTPTFIVFSGDGLEVGRYEGTGNVENILRDVIAMRGLYREPEPEPETKQATPAEPKSEKKSETPSLNLEIFPFEEKETVDESQAFRYRPSVYEFNFDAGFFEDSNSRWLNRNRNRNRNEETKPEPEQKKEPAPAPKVDENKLGDRLGNILGNRLQNGLSDSLRRQLDDFVAETQSKVEARIRQKIEEEKIALVNKWNRIKWWVINAFIFLVIIAVLCAEAIKCGFRAIGRRFQKLRNAYKIYLEQIGNDGSETFVEKIDESNQKSSQKPEKRNETTVQRTNAAPKKRA